MSQSTEKSRTKTITQIMEEPHTVDVAMRLAVRKALRLQLAAGLPVVEWNDGKVVKYYGPQKPTRSKRAATARQGRRSKRR